MEVQIKKSPKVDKINCECCYMLLYVAHIPKLTLHGSPVHFWDGNILNARVNWHCEIFPIPILSNTGHKTHEGNIAKCDAPSDHEGAFVIAHGSSFFIHVVSSLNSAETIRDLMVSHAHKVREYRQSFESFVVGTGTRPVPRPVVDAVFTAQEVSLRGEVLQGIPLGTESFSGWFPKIGGTGWSFSGLVDHVPRVNGGSLPIFDF